MTTIIQFRNRPSPKTRTRLVWPTALAALVAVAAVWALVKLS